MTTCSTRNFEYVKSLGADHVFDAYDPDVGKKIREFTDNKLYYAWDCIGAPEQCAQALASSAPAGQELRYGHIVGWDVKLRDDIISTWSIGYSANGEDWQVGWTEEKRNIEAQPDHQEWMENWIPFAMKLLEEGKWKPHRQDVREGGLGGVVEGLRDMKEGRVSGAKLVYRVGVP